jgi:hypothetical protein
MKTLWKKCRARRGLALMMSLIFLLIFSSLTLSLFSTANTNVQVASNHVQANRARMAAESGLEFMKSWMGQVHLPGSITPQYRYPYLRHFLAADMSAMGVPDVVEGQMLLIGSQSGGMLVNQNGDRFTAVLEPVDQTRARISITGIAGTLQRNLTAEFTYGVREDSVFNFGVATKGPLNLNGNIGILGATMAVEADVYIESDASINALSIIGNSQIAGDVKITNPNAVVTLQGEQAGIGGDTGEAAVTNHVLTGVSHTQFPYPNASLFTQYANGEIITSATNLQHSRTFVNAKVEKGTNPVFNNNVKIEGILYIEAPNVVTFSGGVDITGIIVAAGNVTDNSGTNKLIFQGNVSSHSISELPADSQYAGLRDQRGTFIMAPGFNLSFGGNFGTINGAIAGNGVQFSGNSGGTIFGSVLNYSPVTMNLSGNTDLIFNRSGITDIPSGFLSEIVMYFDPVSYKEPASTQ